MDWSDIDAVVLGKAPDLFEGVMKPELYLTDALGAHGKPMFRVHTAGSVGGTTGIVASHLVETGPHKRVLAVAYQKQSEGNAQFALGSGKGASLGAGGAFAPYMRATSHRSGAPMDIGPMVAVKDRLERAEEPVRALEARRHHHREREGVADDVGPGALPRVVPVLRRRVRGGVHRPGGRRGSGRRPGGSRRGSSAPRCAPSRSAFPGRDPVAPQGAADCAADVYAQAGITRPREQIDCAELYVPFSWYEPMWLEGHHLTDPGDGWKLVECGATALDGSFPVNMSGGVLSSNPIGASGLLRFAEAAMQVRGMAGEHQVDGAKVAIAPGVRRRRRSTSACGSSPTASTRSGRAVG